MWNPLASLPMGNGALNAYTNPVTTSIPVPNSTAPNPSHPSGDLHARILAMRQAMQGGIGGVPGALGGFLGGIGLGGRGDAGWRQDFDPAAWHTALNAWQTQRPMMPAAGQPFNGDVFQAWRQSRPSRFDF